MVRTLDSTLSLNNGRQVPCFGFGTWQLKDETCYPAVLFALEAGYRLIDTAQAYENEIEVGQAVADSQIERGELFITTKISNDNQGYEKAIDSTVGSLTKLKMAYVDLLLIHWPIAGDFERTLETYRALIELRKTGLTRAIGVSNFTISLTEKLIEDSGVVPAVNQVEFHPFLYQEKLLTHARQYGIQLEAYCPIVRAERSSEPVLQAVAKEHNKSPAQIMLAWSMTHGVIPLPRSNNPLHIRENADAFGIVLSEEEMAVLDSLDENYRIVMPEFAPEGW